MFMFIIWLHVTKPLYWIIVVGHLPQSKHRCFTLWSIRTWILLKCTFQHLFHHLMLMLLPMWLSTVIFILRNTYTRLYVLLCCAYCLRIVSLDIENICLYDSVNLIKKFRVDIIIHKRIHVYWQTAVNIRLPSIITRPKSIRTFTR